MKTRFGWDHESWFGQFVDVSAAVLATALFTLTILALVLMRYEVRVASGAVNPPALRTLDGGNPVLVVGADISDVARGADLSALTAALKQNVAGLPWTRALRHRTSSLVPVTSLFFPANGIGEAFALCARLAGIPPACAPAIVSTSELEQLDGGPVGEAVLSRLGIAPYAPPAARTRIAQAPGEHEALASIQPPLTLQPGVVAGHTEVPSEVFWLSSAYRPGDPRLTDVVAAGDVMMGTIGLGLNPDIQRHTDVAKLIGTGLAAVFRHADVAFANLEGPLYGGPAASPKDCTNCYAFHSPPYYADTLASLGLDVVSLANNHSGDYGEAGRESTMSELRAHGIAYAGLDRDGARAASLILPGGRRIAVTAFAPNAGTLNLNDIPGAQALIRDLRKTHDLVIVSFHGGAEGWAHVHVPKGDEVFYGEDRGNVERFAHAAIDAGADLVIGQGPHVPRAVEIYRGHLIAYSLGNFWTYMGVNSYAVSGLGPVLEAWLAPDGTIAGFALHSTRQAGLGVPYLDPLQEAERYTLYLTRSDFPDTARRLDEPSTRNTVASGARVPRRRPASSAPGS